ncbi:Hypothetical predicted protein [Paramuricea clavata]|nr:Hypothetical predicted protein [Paramuricea clavata]
MTRIGFLQFSDQEHTKIRFNLNNNFDAQTIRQKFENMPYYGGPRTLTGLGLQIVHDQGFTETNGDRPDVPDIVVVLTDGQSRNPQRTIDQAKRLKDKGVRIIAIGAGYDLQRVKDDLERELLNIASSPDDVKMVDFANLENIVFEIVNKVCKVVTTPKPPTQATQVQAISNNPTTRFRAPAPAIITNWLGATTQPQEPSTTLAPVGCSGSVGKDILFVVDGTVNFQQSYDQSRKDFKRIRGFMRATIRDLDNDKFRVGVMQYTGKGTARMEIDFMSSRQLKEIKIRLGTIVQQRGYKRFTGDALVKANSKFYELDAFQQRERYPNVIVLITRGTPNDRDHAISEARMLESRNVRLVSVGVNSGASTKYLAAFLREITYPKFMFLPKYRDLKKGRATVLDAMCVKATTVPKAGLPRDSASCRRGPHDIFFVIDGSASIKYYNFEKVQIFLMDLISLLRVEASEINTGLMQFSKEDQTSVVWDLGRYTEFESIINLRNMKYQAGTRTATGDALTRVNNEIFTGRNGDRPGISDIVILFTDGNAHDLSKAREQSKILREKGILVITIGAGTKESLRTFKQELIDMASSPEYAMTVNFEQLEFFAEKAFPLVCRYMRLKRL